MKNTVKKYFQKVLSLVSSLAPNQSIEKSKEKWNKLASENARYYVVSRKGTEINEEEFGKTGEENYREHVESDSLLKEKLGSFLDKKVLNIGSGIGRLEKFFSPNFKEVHGVDISEEMVAQARERAKENQNVTFHATDGLHYPFDDNDFDLVFSYIVFQHMPSTEVVEQNFREIARVLKPQGIAKIQIRGGHQPYKWQWFYGPAFKKDAAIAMVERTGLKVLKTEGENTKRFWLWLAK